MKKTFLKSAVATAVVAAVVALSSVVAFAATNTYYYVGGNPPVNTDNRFTIPDNGTTANYGGTFSFTGETTTYTTGTSYNSAKMASGVLTFEVAGTAEAEIIWGVRTNKSAGSKLKYTAGGSTEEITINETGVISGYTRSNISGLKGKVSLTKASGDEIRIYGIKVVDTVSDSAKTYTISGTSNVPEGTKLTIDGNEVTVGAEGSWSYTKTSEAAPYTDGQTITVETGFTSKYIGADTTLSYDGNVTYTAEINLTEGVLEEIPNGEYKSSAMAGFPYFDFSGASTGVKNGSIKPNNGETIKFKVADNKVVSILFKSGSGTASNTAKLEIYDESNTLVKESQTLAGGAAEEYFVLDNLSAGTYTIKSVAGSSSQITCFTVADKGLTKVDSGAIYVTGADTYLIAAVSADSLSKSSLSIGFGASKTPVDTTDTVYASVVIGDDTITAAQVGGDCLYAVQVTGANLSTKLNSFKVYYAD